MTFTDILREENDNIFQAIFNHPFVDGIGKGRIPNEALAHYVKADFEYLSAFMRLYGIAISRATDREDIHFFSEQVQFILNSETHPHHNFCDHIGIRYEALQGHPLPPTADHYMKHMMYHAQRGSMGDIISALLPCPWTYMEIGDELMKRYKPETDHPFYDWIRFYTAKSTGNTTTKLRERLDQLAADASASERDRMKEAFRKSCQMEYSFWEMAYTCEEWPVGKVVTSI